MKVAALTLPIVDILEATVELRRQAQDRPAVVAPCLKSVIVDCATEGLISVEEADGLLGFYGLREA